MGFAAFDDAYPWDALAPWARRARAHPGGMVDLSIGTPVDPTPDLVRDALAGAGDAPGYPTTQGSPALRDAVVRWFARSRSVPDLDPAAVCATVGSKELVGLLPSLLRVGPGDVVVHPAIAYPTYAVGARLAGGEPLACDETSDWENDSRVRLVWVNSPGNPTGEVLSRERLRRIVLAARRLGAVVVSDECYAELPWTEDLVRDGVASLLDPQVTCGDLRGLLAISSLSKRSTMAGYRAGFVAGDRDLVARLVAIRKHLGLIVPAPVQAAMVAALGDDVHVRAQYERYAVRRRLLAGAFRAAGYEIAHSAAGLYLWARHRDLGSGWACVADLAERGILVAPGDFYGPAGAQYVRISLTAADERVRDAVERLR